MFSSTRPRFLSIFYPKYRLFFFFLKYITNTRPVEFFKISIIRESERDACAGKYVRVVNTHLRWMEILTERIRTS